LPGKAVLRGAEFLVQGLFLRHGGFQPGNDAGVLFLEAGPAACDSPDLLFLLAEEHPQSFQLLRELVRFFLRPPVRLVELVYAGLQVRDAGLLGCGVGHGGVHARPRGFQGRLFALERLASFSNAAVRSRSTAFWLARDAAMLPDSSSNRCFCSAFRADSWFRYSMSFRSCRAAR